MTETFDCNVIGGEWIGRLRAAAKRASEGRSRVLLLATGLSNRHPLLDMPPDIFKMINGSKHMRYHLAGPQARLDRKADDIPQGMFWGTAPNINDGKTNAPAMMLGDRWADL